MGNFCHREGTVAKQQKQNMNTALIAKSTKDQNRDSIRGISMDGHESSYNEILYPSFL